VVRSADEISALAFYDGEHGFGTEKAETTTDRQILNAAILFEFDAVDLSVCEGRMLKVTTNALVKPMRIVVDNNRNKESHMNGLAGTLLQKCR
jgi:hypothetical protein